VEDIVLAMFYRSVTTTVVLLGASAVGEGQTTSRRKFHPCRPTVTRIIVADTIATLAVPRQLEPNFNHYFVTACSDDANLTLSAPYGGLSLSGISMFYHADDPQWQRCGWRCGKPARTFPDLPVVRAAMWLRLSRAEIW